jgi:hypothetical protein
MQIYTTTSDIFNPSLNTTMVTFGTAHVPAMRIYWQASDLSIFDTAYGSALAARLKINFTPTPISGASSSQTASPALTSDIPGPTSAPSSPVLTPGAKVGISLGSICGAAAIFLVLYLTHRWRKRKTRDPEVHREDDFVGADAPEVAEADDPTRRAWETSELEAKSLNELPGPIAELDGAAVREEDHVDADDSILKVEEPGGPESVSRIEGEVSPPTLVG